MRADSHEMQAERHELRADSHEARGKTPEARADHHDAPTDEAAARKSVARIPELDYLRVVSMFAVIMIHVSSGFIFRPSGVTLGGMNVAFMLNQAARFAVPLFILLSGASLTLKHGLVGAVNGFYRRNLSKIILPYLFWSLVFCIDKYEFGALIGGAVPPSVIVEGFLFGRFASHLYFIVVLTQCYILYPVLRRLVGRYPVQTLVVCLALSVSFQWALGLQTAGLVLPAIVRGYGWISFPSWIFFFCAGMFANRERLEILFRAASKALAPCAAAAVFFAWLLATDSLLAGTHTSSLKPQIMFYTALVTFALSGLARRLAAASLRLSRAVAFLANRSFVVYFSHVLALNIILTQAPAPTFFPGTVGMASLYLLVAGVSVLFAAAVGIVRRRINS